MQKSVLGIKQIQSNFVYGSFIVWAIVPFLLFRTAQDSLITKNTAEFIRNELARGIDIKDIIANLENKNSLVSFIDNGYQKTEELPWEVQNALSGLENGRCSEPLPYEKGWIMYQKIQSTKTLTLYNTIFVQALPKTASLLGPGNTSATNYETGIKHGHFSKQQMNLALVIL